MHASRQAEAIHFLACYLALGRGVIGHRSGFFLHTPWLPPSLLVSLPNHRQLVQSLLSYDVIGFHSHEWRQAFIDYVTAHLDARMESDRAIFGGPTSLLLICPIGLHTVEFCAAVGTPAALKPKRG